MPELPDVEVFRRHLEKTALKQKVRNAEVLDAQIVEEISPHTLRTKVKRKSLTGTRRRGKYLFVSIDRNGWLIFHFGMTGFFRYFDPKKSAVEKHDRALLHFANGKALAFNCARKLGFLSYTRDAERYISKKELGPDALDFDLEQFRDFLRKGRGALKPLLMNQERIAGIGNVYSDEILFQSSLDPRVSASSLDSKKQKFLFTQMRKVLKTAIDRKADPGKFPRSYLTGHRAEGERCPKCGDTIQKIRVSGRSCYFCPGHQR